MEEKRVDANIERPGVCVDPQVWDICDGITQRCTKPVVFGYLSAPLFCLACLCSPLSGRYVRDSFLDQDKPGVDLTPPRNELQCRGEMEREVKRPGKELGTLLLSLALDWPWKIKKKFQ